MFGDETEISCLEYALVGRRECLEGVLCLEVCEIAN